MSMTLRELRMIMKHSLMYRLRDLLPPGLPTFIGILLMSATAIGYSMGIAVEGTRSVRKQVLIEKGLAEYTLNPKTGNTSFKLKKE